MTMKKFVWLVLIAVALLIPAAAQTQTQRASEGGVSSEIDRSMSRTQRMWAKLSPKARRRLIEAYKASMSPEQLETYQGILDRIRSQKNHSGAGEIGIMSSQCTHTCDFLADVYYAGCMQGGGPIYLLRRHRELSAGLLLRL